LALRVALSSASVWEVSDDVRLTVPSPLRLLVPESVSVVQLLLCINAMAVETAPLPKTAAEPLMLPDVLAVVVLLALELLVLELELRPDSPRSRLVDALALPVAEVPPLEALEDALPLPPTLMLKASAGTLNATVGPQASSSTNTGSKCLLVISVSADLVQDNFSKLATQR
jgi:hypothetical protein